MKQNLLILISNLIMTGFLIGSLHAWPVISEVAEYTALNEILIISSIIRILTMQ